MAILAVAFIATVAVGLVAGTNNVDSLERKTYTAAYSMDVGGLTRSWEVIAPVAALPDSEPIVIVLSGIAAPVASEVRRDMFVPYVDAGLAELVYPAGIGKSWNAIGCCGKAAARNVDDIAFVKALVANVDPGHEHPIDLVGYSNGGRLAYRMACTVPGLFDATAVVKAMPMPGCVVTRPLTIMQVDSLNDPAVPYQPGDHGRESPPATVEVGLLRTTDGCAQRPAVSRYLTMTVTTWSNCASGARVGFAVYDSGGHSFPQPKGKNPGASSVIWAFFTKTAIAPLPK